MLPPRGTLANGEIESSFLFTNRPVGRQEYQQLADRHGEGEVNGHPRNVPPVRRQNATRRSCSQTICRAEQGMGQPPTSSEIEMFTRAHGEVGRTEIGNAPRSPFGFTEGNDEF